MNIKRTAAIFKQRERTNVMEKEFLERCSSCGFTADELERLKAGETVVSYRFIPDLNELSRTFCRADDKIRNARDKVFFSSRDIQIRSRLGQGIHDRAEAILFARGKPQSQSDIDGMKIHQPHPVKLYAVKELVVAKNECVDFSAFSDDFKLRLVDDLLCSVTIDRLVLEENASVCIKGNLFSLWCHSVVKNGSGNKPDILILPTQFSYSQGFRGYGESFDGENGCGGKDGHDGYNNHTPDTRNCLLGNLHFGGERGVKNGGDGEDGTDGENGGRGLGGGALKTAELFFYEIYTKPGERLYIKAKGGDGGNGGNGGRGGNGGNGGSNGDAYRVYTPEKILSFKKGKRGNGGNGGNGGRGGNGGNGGICSNVFVEVPAYMLEKIICVSESGKGGVGGKGGAPGTGGKGEVDGRHGMRGVDGKDGHDRAAPPMYINSKRIM